MLLLFSTLQKILLNSRKEEVPWSLRLDHKCTFILSKASTSVPTSIFDLGFSILYDSTEPKSVPLDLFSLGSELFFPLARCSDS